MDRLICGDALVELDKLPSELVDCCITSPPYYGLRDYGVDGQIGLESSPEAYVARLVGVFREVKRVLKDEGTLWLNLGDSYNGSGGQGTKPNIHGTHLRSNCKTGVMPKHLDNLKPKDLIGIPWMVAFALRTDGWYLRSDIIWHKPNCMPESVTDRPTKSHEYVFLLSKKQKYYYDSDAMKEDQAKTPGSITHRKPHYEDVNSDPKGGGFRGKGGLDGRIETGKRNKRTVWTIPTRPYKEAHFATFPEALVEPCILAGCPEGGAVLDPFFGAGTVGVVAKKLGRSYIGIELNEEYVAIAKKRLSALPMKLTDF